VCFPLRCCGEAAAAHVLGRAAAPAGSEATCCAPRAPKNFFYVSTNSHCLFVHINLNICMLRNCISHMCIHIYCILSRLPGTVLVQAGTVPVLGIVRSAVLDLMLFLIVRFPSLHVFVCLILNHNVLLVFARYPFAELWLFKCCTAFRQVVVVDALRRVLVRPIAAMRIVLFLW